MSGITYREVFQQAFGSPVRTPYSYQCRLACGADASPDLPKTLTRGTTCHSHLIEVPTGLGKTAAVVLAWLWNRVLQPDKEARAKWPRRLVYCLPMRTLVEQTRDNVHDWLAALGLNETAGVQLKETVGIHILMGGEDSGDWDIYPEREAVLIGTQDMVLSRALNRGYGMSRYRWPMHFGLLNNDCLWVMDEIQLMGVTLETSAQLDGFRSRPPEWSPWAGSPTWWMSATLDPTRLATVDHPEPTSGWPRIILSEVERSSGEVRQRYEARKPIAKAELTLNAASKKDYPNQLAKLIAAKHKGGTLTLIVVNRVVRAQELYNALRDKKLKLDATRIGLIHSRFRPQDRERHTAVLFGEGDRIVVATQAVEAGVDVSARLLVTELAPWSSLVQRFGRCNRGGEFPDAEVLWIDMQLKDEKDDLAAPYLYDELNKSRTALAELTDAGPRSLVSISVSEATIVRPVLRRRDLLDLFDTTPDLCGQDLDISRYIRDSEDNDVQFFWRAVKGDRPEEEEAPPARRELCRVSIGEAAKFLKKEHTRAWRWNPLDEVWVEARRPHAGAIYLVDVASGGYTDDEGWTGDPKSKVTAYPPTEGEAEAYGKDRSSFTRCWQNLAEHTSAVVSATEELTTALALDGETAATLRTAALWHDVGKAHEKFQAMLCGRDVGRLGTLWAKSGNHEGKCERAGFRHELASALAWLLAGPTDSRHWQFFG